jgi:hypothetical protein
MWLAGEMLSGEDFEFWHRVFFGDKDAIRWTHLFLGVPMGEVEWYLGSIGYEDQTAGGRFCGQYVMLFITLQSAHQPCQLYGAV